MAIKKGAYSIQMGGIGYNQLSLEEKKAYEQFEKAFKNYSSFIDSSNINRNIDVMKILNVVLGDNPRIFYFDSSRIRTTATVFRNHKIELNDVVSSPQARTMEKQLEEALSKAIEEIELFNPMNSYEKLLCIYEYLQDNLSYDSKEMEAVNRLGRCSNTMSHNAYGVLVSKTGVCGGISSVFTLLAQRMGFECTTVNGKSTFNTSSFVGHSWNVIKIEESYYHIDATWDINKKEYTGEYSYEYFCMSDESMKVDHSWDTNTIPTCSHDDISFYKRNRCYAYSLSQLDDIFTTYSKSNQKVVRVKIDVGVSIPEPEEQYVAQKFANIAVSMGKKAEIKYIWEKDTRCFLAILK